MQNQIAELNHLPFSSAFFNALAGAITEACGSPWLVAAVPDAELNPDESQPVWLELTLDGGLRGQFQLEFRRAEAIALISRCSRQEIEEFGAEEADLLLRVINAAIGEFQSAASKEYGVFTVRASSASEPPADKANVVQVTAADDDSNRVTVLMYLSQELAEGLSLRASSSTVAAETGKAPKAATPESKSDAVNLKLVMDVELNVTLRFGQRMLTLREVLELTTGSVVELDRQVEEPVELLLDGKVIARGEAVVIDGNYGLRVTEVLQSISSPLLQ
jgi:flagellar motor switch protein FliN/FliY